jgi:ligand-binding sensor domain-containing protein
MISKPKSHLVIDLVAALGVLQIVSAFVSAEKLPIRSYTTADGLGHNNVQRIVTDSRGFIWFCTFEGISRFDGYSFTTYGPDQGLPSQVVNDFLETGDGQYWVATDAGLCFFNPRGIPRRRTTNDDSAAPDAMFKVYAPGSDVRSNQVSSVLQDRSGQIWCGTANGLYRVDRRSVDSAVSFVEIGIAGGNCIVHSIIEDHRSAKWIGTEGGIYRLLPDGGVEHYSRQQGLPVDFIHSLLEDREGRLWAGTREGGLCRLVSDPEPARPVVARVYSTKDGLPTNWINQVFQASDGSLWAGCNQGLIRFVPAADNGEVRFRSYSESNGLISREVQSLAEDRNGNLWLGIANGGAAKLARSGITAFGRTDGFQQATAIFKDNAGPFM